MSRYSVVEKARELKQERVKIRGACLRCGDVKTFNSVREAANSRYWNCCCGGEIAIYGIYQVENMVAS